MRRRRTPHEKKVLAYERDHPTYAEYPHAFRAAWPKRKAIEERSFRRRAKRALTADDDGTVDAVHRKPLSKWPPPSLREHVRDALEARAFRTAHNLFKRPYVGVEHREPFTRVLEALITERRGKARDHARAFALFLEAGSQSPFAARRAWLDGYFRDEPQMRERLRAWICSTERR